MKIPGLSFSWKRALGIFKMKRDLIPILNDNLIALFEKYNYNVLNANEQVLNRYIKNILKDLFETEPSLKEKVPTKLTMKQKEAMRRDKIEPEADLNGKVIVPRYACVSSHTPYAQASRICT